ncbi:MAG: diacylglycerol kinase family lipid kinase [Rhodobiaceae bacterium]|nr:diacylglycerol kinase family lipid kinase [Rhodobiaceae bacterium]MCC0057138.1 diacylglycerol kinase family lipid kinase [Rhodobiaceae bacterium]
MRITAVLNPNSGTLRTDDPHRLGTVLERLFGEQGHELDYLTTDGSNLIETLEGLASDPSLDAIIACGGDGTASAAAGIAWAHDKAIGILPGGTMNLFARSLGLPLDVELAAEALAAGYLANADIATANGRPFIHQLSVGLHPRTVRLRRAFSYHSRLGKVLASIRAFLASIGRPPVFQVEIETPSGRWSGPLSALSVSNNPYGPGHLPYADSLDSGQLGIYTAGPLDRRQSLQIAADMTLGSWDENPFVKRQLAPDARITFPDLASSARAVIDGELIPLERAIDFKLHAGALKVLMPKRAD